MTAGGVRFVGKLANEPWLCSPEHLQFLHSLFLRYLDRVGAGEKLDVQAVEQITGKPLDNTRIVSNKGGVARIPVEGTIVRRGNLFSEASGMVSTETITKDFVSAYEDASVHSILFVFDTPGGEAYGINELASLIRQKRDEGTKPIEAFCDGTCASAGYYLASATGRITAEPTSSVGSIGTVVRVFNPQAAGKTPYLEFVNARSPNKRPDPNTPAGRDAIQGWIDDLGDEFIRFVAESRGVSFEKVVEDFGQGFVMIGKRALKAGMVDALGIEGEVVGRLQWEHGSGSAPPRRVRSSGTAGTTARPRTLASKNTINRKESPVQATRKLETRAAVNAAIGEKAEEIRRRDGVGPGVAKMRAWQESPHLAERYNELPQESPKSPGPVATGGAAMQTATARAKELMKKHPGRYSSIASARVEVYRLHPELADRVRNEQAAPARSAAV